jgi:hypothetical protein
MPAFPGVELSDWPAVLAHSSSTANRRRWPGLAQLESRSVDETFLTVAEIAEQLRLNQQTVRNWI